MKKKLNPNISKKSFRNFKENSATLTGHHDLTTMTSASSTNLSRNKDSSIRKKSSRSIINCQSVSNFQISNKFEIHQAEFDIAPIKENKLETSFIEEDSLLIELADFLSPSNITGFQHNVCNYKPTRKMNKRLSHPSNRIKIDVNNITKSNKRLSGATIQEPAQHLERMKNLEMRCVN